MTTGGWIDVSVDLVDGMAFWPGNPPVSISRHLDRARGDAANVSALFCGVHSGTHLDAPVHFIDGAGGIESLDPGAGIGPARVVEAPPGPSITAEAVAAVVPRAGERIIWKTANSPAAWQTGEFDRDAVHLDGAAAEALAAAGVALVGIDYLSVGGFRCGNADAAHRPLLDAGAWILEGLDLAAVEPGDYELCAVPLRIPGCDASPVRALLRPVVSPA